MIILFRYELFDSRIPLQQSLWAAAEPQTTTSTYLAYASLGITTQLLSEGFAHH